MKALTDSRNLLRNSVPRGSRLADNGPMTLRGERERDESLVSSQGVEEIKPLAFREKGRPRCSEGMTPSLGRGENGSGKIESRDKREGGVSFLSWDPIGVGT